MPKCTILVGVPGSGKSTWRWANRKSILTASTDKIIESTALENGMTYNEAFRDLISFAEKAMWRLITLAMLHEQDFVIDRTNLSVKSRKKFIDKLKLHRYEIECVVFPIPGSENLPTEEWNRRLDSRPGKTIPSHILSSMIEHYEPPTLSEGFSRITFI